MFVYLTIYQEYALMHNHTGHTASTAEASVTHFLFLTCYRECMYIVYVNKFGSLAAYLQLSNFPPGVFLQLVSTLCIAQVSQEIKCNL